MFHNPFIAPTNLETARSTFSIDVDTTSYSNSRGAIEAGHMPDPRTVRIVRAGATSPLMMSVAFDGL